MHRRTFATETVPAGLPLILVGAAIAFSLVLLSPEIRISTPHLNDTVLHYALIESTEEAIHEGANPLDFWIPDHAMGYPLFHHYQHLPHLAVVGIYHGLFKTVSLWKLFAVVRYLLLALFPLSVFVGARMLGFGVLTSAFAAAAAPLLSTNQLYGFEYNSYVWLGYGMYTQLVGMVLLPLAVGSCSRTQREGKSYFLSVLLLSALTLSHTVYAYVATLTVLLLPFLSWPEKQVRRRLVRQLIMLALVAGVVSYFVFPFVLDSQHMNRSVWEYAHKYDSYGHRHVLTELVRGGLFDSGRWPVLTLMLFLGLGAAVFRRRTEDRLTLGIFLFWLLLYFGRPTWGVLLHILPMMKDVHMHRFIGGVQLGGLLAIGLGATLVFRWFKSERAAWRSILALAVCVALLLPALRERRSYLQSNESWLTENQRAFSREGPELAALLGHIRHLPPGRVYAGLAGNWGNDFTVGSVPVYALVARDRLDQLGHLYHALSFNADIQGHLDESRWSHYNLFNVRYVVSDSTRDFPEFVTPVAQFGRFVLHAVRTTGYFDLVASNTTLVIRKEEFYPTVMRWFRSGLLESGQFPSVGIESSAEDGRSRPGSGGEGIPVPGSLSRPSGRMISEEISRQSASVDVEVTEPSHLLFKSTFHPGWRAWVDGVERDIRRVTPSFMAVPLGPGSHRVEFRYQPGMSKTVLPIVGWLLLLLVALAEARGAALGARLRRTGTRISNAFGRAGVNRLLPAPGPETLLAAKERAGDFCILAILSILVSLPLLQMRQMAGHDALEYAPRLVEFLRGLGDGHLFPRWAPDLGAGYGYPLFNFNPPLIYYLGAFFSGVGAGIIEALNWASVAIVLGSALGMYLCAREFFGRSGGVVAAAAYILSPYFLTELYVRNALSEFSCFPWIPLCLLFFYRLVRFGGAGALAGASLSLGALLLSSNPISLLFVPFLGLYAAFWILVQREKRALVRGLAGLAIGLGLSAFFWLPALWERSDVSVHRLLEGYLNYENHFVYLHQLFYSDWGYGLSLRGPDDGMSFHLGWVPLAGFIFALWARTRLRTDPDVSRISLFFVLASAAAAVLMSPAAAPLWRQLPLLQFVEFPWRILALVTALSSFLVGFPLLLLRRTRPQWVRPAQWTLIGVILVLNLPHARPSGYHSEGEVATTATRISSGGLAVTTAREYEPRWVQSLPPRWMPGELEILRGEAEVLASEARSQQLEFEVKAAAPTRFRLHTNYFPGWELMVDEAPQPIDFDNDHGVMEFETQAGVHRIRFAFARTLPRATGSIASTLSAAGLVGLVVFGSRRRWRRASPASE